MRILMISILVLSLAACSHGVQTSSGVEYLERFQHAASNVSGTPVAGGPDEIIARAAGVEPILTFPAKFGVARIEGGQLTSIPSEEVALWTDLVAKKQSLGRFVPISPLIAKFTASAVMSERKNNYGGNRTGDLVTMIRLGAARQHVDAVLIYEVGASARKENTALAFVDLTIIGGAFLPTRTLDAQGIAQALLLDVRNGYPYGTASAVADLSSYSVSWGSDRRRDDLRKDAALKVIENLVPEVDAMFDDLVTEMAVRTLKKK